MKEDLINNLIQTEFIELKDEDLSKYNYDDIIQESLNTINNLENTLKTKKETKEENVIKDEYAELTPNPDNKEGNTNEKEKENEKENNINKKASMDENEIISEKDIPIKYLSNPFNFVDYIEYEQPNEKMKKIKNKFILKNYEKKNQTKFEIININIDGDLNKVIFPINDLLTCIYYYEDFLITGNIIGQTKIFSLSDKKLVKQFDFPSKSAVNTKVTTIHISNDSKYIYIGYTNGNIAVCDLKSQKVKLLISDIINNCECLCIKFLNKEGKFSKIIISDQKGNVFLVTIKDGYRGFRVTDKQNLYQDKNYPVYLIKLIKFNEQYLKIYSFLKNLNNYIIFGSLKNIEIYSLINYSKINLEFKIEKPEFIKDYIVGDISFGIGKHPQSRESLGEDDDEPQILMCTSYDNVICLYIIPIDNGDLTFPVLIGHYFNINENGNNQIIKIGFLSKGAIFLIDRNNYLKLLNTRKFVRGNPPKKNEFLTSIDKYSFAELQEIYQINSEINKQINLLTPENNYKQTFINSIVENIDNGKVAILSNDCIYIVELINYEECLRKLQQNEKWMDMFILGIEIYKGKITCLKGLPSSAEERKKKLREFLQQLISVYIIADDMNQKNKYKGSLTRRNSFYENQENLKHTEKKIEIIIEFCSEIEGFDFLLDKILNMYETKGYGDLFLSKLESFILCDKMLKYEINEDLILKLIQLYEEKNKINILNKLLLHIDIKSLSSATVNSKIKELSLLPPMINIFVNGDNPDYFKPITIMYELYQKANPLNFNSYEKIIKSKNLSEIINSKEYKGHKLFWYIRKCFIKRKYPYFVDNMEEKDYEKYIMDLIFWIMKENIMKDLVEFNSENYFEILNKILGDERNIEIINKYNSNKDNVKKKMRNLNEQNYNYAYKDLSPLNIANYIIEHGKNIKDSQKIQLDYHLFIIRTFKNTKISKDIVINSIISILSIYTIVYKNPAENIVRKIIFTIINILNNNIFTEGDYQKILLHFNDHIFDEIKAFIYEKINQYKSCLELFINKDSIIEKKEEKLFNYVDKTLSLLKKKEKDNHFIDFKNLVMENMVNIGEISETKMLEIIYKWFYQDKDDKKKLIDILAKNPKMQFKYVELLSKQIIVIFQENEEIENDIIYEDKNFITTTLGIYIQLLCQLGQKDRVLTMLKKCPFFPIDTCIKICEEYNVKNALIYLYQLSGDFQNALNTTLKTTDEIYSSLFNNITSDIFKNVEYEHQIRDFNNSINQSIEILVKNQSQNMPNNTHLIRQLSDTDNLWFHILNKLYTISMNYDKQLKIMSQKRIKFGIIFEETLSDNIKDVLEKMSIYIGVRRILDEVSEKNKSAGYKEFKPILLKIFETYDNQGFILNSVRRLMIYLCFENIRIFKIENLKGKKFQLIKCDVCQENFSKNQDKEGKKILVFKCKHVMHYYCSYTQEIKNINTFLCPICRKNEIDNAISNMSLSLMGRNRAFVQNKRVENETKIKLNDVGIDVNRFKRGYNKLRNFDMNSTIKRENFVEQSVKSCRKKYRKHFPK